MKKIVLLRGRFYVKMNESNDESRLRTKRGKAHVSGRMWMMKTKQMTGTPDLRNKLVTDMVSQVEAICRRQGCTPTKPVLKRFVEAAIDAYIDDWYEVSLEAMDLMEGRADFVTDDAINDPEIIEEAKRRVVKTMYEDRPPEIHEHIAGAVISEMADHPLLAECQPEEANTEVAATGDDPVPDVEEAAEKAKAKAKKPKAKAKAKPKTTKKA